MGVLRWRGDAAHSSYDNSVIIRAIQQNQCMGKVGDNNHHWRIRVENVIMYVIWKLCWGVAVHRSWWKRLMMVELTFDVTIVGEWHVDLRGTWNIILQPNLKWNNAHSTIKRHMTKQCAVDKLMRIKDDAYLVAVELMGGGLVYRLCPTWLPKMKQMRVHHNN